VGTELGDVELLTVSSFVKHGHKFHLWTYDDIKTPLPNGVKVMDAREIMPKEKVFCYPEDSDIDMEFAKGSYAGFSDIFRYKLLYEKGGWWADMDVTCLKPFHHLHWNEYFFRSHWELPLVGNVMRVPPKSDLMKRCYKEASEKITEDNEEWHKPIQILCDAVKDFGLSKYIRYGLGNVDHMTELDLYLYRDTSLNSDLWYPLPPPAFPDAWYFVHWMNATGEKKAMPESALFKLLNEYDLMKTKML
jgi:hypothetical protein